MRYIVANWKSHKQLPEVEEWFIRFASHYALVNGVEVVVAPSFPYLAMSRVQVERLGLSGVKLASQDISPFPLGAYTGAVAVEMVREWVEFGIVGHSERREYFHESNQEIANKAALLVEAKITPIVCVDEPYAEAQIAALETTISSEILVAYEPLGAIGSGIPQDPSEVEAVARKISQRLPHSPILYGGSVTASNAAKYLAIEGVSGLLVGGASLEADQFAEIVTVAG